MFLLVLSTTFTQSSMLGVQSFPPSSSSSSSSPVVTMSGKESSVLSAIQRVLFPCFHSVLCCLFVFQFLSPCLIQEATVLEYGRTMLRVLGHGAIGPPPTSVCGCRGVGGGTRGKVIIGCFVSQRSLRFWARAGSER